MGDARFNAGDWYNYSASVAAAPRAAIFTSSGLHDSLDPSKFKFRESVDSDSNPKSTPIIIGCDETGSMGYLAEDIIKRGLGTVMKEIYERKPVTDPHILIAGIGDATSDRAPIQVTQFEAGVAEITKQVEKIYIEGNGGGNGGESYPILWYFAANKTKCDAITKRKRKGYLFTVGDECPINLSKSQIKEFFGDDVESDMSIKDLLVLVSKNWQVFHIIVQTSATEIQGAVKVWRDILGQRAILIPDKSKLAEVIVSTIQVIEGEDADKVADSWDGTTSVVVRNAIKNLDKASSATGDLVHL